MIAVTGATGQLGRLVIDQLVAKVPAEQIVAIARNADKAEPLKELGVVVRIANYDTPHTLDKALQGVEKLLLISGSEVGKRTPQHHAVITAAKKAGVNLLAYTSLLRADQARMSLSVEHVATEMAIGDSAIPSVLLRNSWYVENYTANLGTALQTGVILGAAGNGRIAAATRADYAAAAVAVLTTPGHADKVYELGGDEPFTMEEYAAEVSRQSGQNVRYQDMPADEYANTLRSFGLPPPFAAALASADEGIARGELDTNSGDLRRLIGRPTTPLGCARG
jgi:NAD(P)H dehydrogenase (quinone)